MNIAIVAVAYNRLDALKQLIASLEKAYYEEPITLIISIDKSDTEIVESFADNYVWAYGEKIVDKHNKNLGLRAHMMSLGKWFDLFDAIIVLEDDIVVSPNYLNFTKQAVEKYHNCDDIAGIGLYSFSVNYQTNNLFQPVRDEHDVYFMNCAMSWGEVWMRESWLLFYEWYEKHQVFNPTNYLPQSICRWNQKSWLKYHTRYCIENNKFFVYPYTSLSTDCGYAGEHNDGKASSIFQVSLQNGNKRNYALPDFGENAVYYNGFFENIALYGVLGFSEENLCLDLNGEINNRTNKRYWLTTKVRDYKIVKSFGLSFRPIEANVLFNYSGSDIFLYDTTIHKNNHIKKKDKSLLYYRYLSNGFKFIRRYGVFLIADDFWELVKRKTREILHLL